MDPKTYKFDTLSLHAGYQPSKNAGSRQVPIYQTTSYMFDDVDHAAALFNLERGGHIYSRMSNPTVSLVAVVAKPDEKWGETPCAFVELAPGKNSTEEEIIQFCKENMAGFKRPKNVIFGELPKTSTGKIQKFELRKKAKEI